MEPSLWTMLVSVLSRCPFTQEKGQKNSFKKMFNSPVIILHMEMIILRMHKHLGENKTEIWFSISCRKYIFLKICWHKWLQTKFLTEIYTILDIKNYTAENEDTKELLFNRFYFSKVFCVVFVFIQSIGQSFSFSNILFVSWFKKLYLSRWVFHRYGNIAVENIGCYWFQGFGLEFFLVHITRISRYTFSMCTFPSNFAFYFLKQYLIYTAILRS